MDKAFFAASDAGRVVHTRTGYDAFVPADLPPRLNWDSRAARAVEAAASAAGEASALLSSDASSQFSTVLLYREATSTAYVEGQPATLEEVFTAAVTGMDVSRGTRLALNCVGAYRHVEARLSEMPLSLRLLREVHSLLSRGLEHSGSYPGEFRRSQNWLGKEGCGLNDATLVPPPVEEMKAALNNWEHYLHSTYETPAMATAALLHYQFEIIRPFLEYNEASILVIMPFILRELGIVRQPVPVTAGFVRRRLQEHQQRMLDVCQRGAWAEWLTFYLFGMAAALREVSEVIRRLNALRAEHLARAQGHSEFVLQVLDAAWHLPALTMASVSELTGMPEAMTTCATGELVQLGILERREQPLGAVYVATEIISAMEQNVAFGGGYPPFF